MIFVSYFRIVLERCFDALNGLLDILSVIDMDVSRHFVLHPLQRIFFVQINNIMEKVLHTATGFEGGWYHGYAEKLT